MTLRIDGLRASYGDTTVLRGVDLVVPRSRVVALLGPNGAGKSTLLRCCSGLLAPTHGSIQLDDVDMTWANPHERVERGLCHITEGRAVFPSLTVRENLVLMSPTGGDDAIDRAVDAFPVLGRKLAQISGSMSGGEQQMLALARAYVTQPSFVLLDEVSMGLAPIVLDEIFEFLTRLAESGVALLVVEQYVEKALTLADLVYVLQKGSITFRGEAAELDAEALAATYLGAETAPPPPVPR